MSKPWSKLKSRIEAIWVPNLKMAIHTTPFTYKSTYGEYQIPRHWIALDKHIIWDFPFPFIGDNPSPRGKPIAYYEEAYCVSDNVAKPIARAPHNTRYSPLTSSIVAIILRHYLDRPREQLLEPFPEDEWELADILRAADSRLGRSKLLDWAQSLDQEHPALAVIQARFPGACRLRPLAD